MALLDDARVQISKLIPHASRIGDHFNQAVLTIHICREFQDRVDYSNRQKVKVLAGIVNKAEQALKNVIQNPSKSAPFKEFREAIEQTNNIPNVVERWTTAKELDDRRKNIFKAIRGRLKQSLNSSERETYVFFVDPNERIFNLDERLNEKRTTVIVKYRQTDSLEGLLWLFTRDRFSSGKLEILPCPHFYQRTELEKLDRDGDAMPIHDLSQSPSSLRLLWDYDLLFYFEVAVHDLSLSYGNIWHLNQLKDSPFVFKERSSGKLTLSTNVIRQIDTSNMKLRSPDEEAPQRIFIRNVPTDLVTGVLEMLKNRTPGNWNLVSADLPLPSTSIATTTGQSSNGLYVSVSVSEGGFSKIPIATVAFPIPGPALPDVLSFIGISNNISSLPVHPDPLISQNLETERPTTFPSQFNPSSLSAEVSTRQNPTQASFAQTYRNNNLDRHAARQAPTRSDGDHQLETEKQNHSFNVAPANAQQDSIPSMPQPHVVLESHSSPYAGTNIIPGSDGMSPRGPNVESQRSNQSKGITLNPPSATPTSVDDDTTVSTNASVPRPLSERSPPKKRGWFTKVKEFIGLE
ncbi:hypothetical protein L218DRAFT_219298 [Marasmius fiardii PR-910]|nr:hypothetical protein L218DRAFT_219298 [Marasmius fiardii PR-910]